MRNLEIFALNELSESEVTYTYAVIIAKYREFWVLCKHKERTTWEIPGGTREENELIELAAQRELFEETGAVNYKMKEEFAFLANGSYALVYSAEIFEFQPLGFSEIECINFFSDLSLIDWTYPDIQPHLLDVYIEKYQSI